MRGYLDVLAERGLPAPPSMRGVGSFTALGGEQAMRTLLARRRPPTAVFCMSDEMAYGVLRTLRRRGLRVPQDVAVMGFDDHPTAELMDLSTVHQPVAEQALDITTRLLAAIAAGSNGGGGTDAAASADVVLPTDVVVRGSTDPARTVY